jgi:hypothetical protein
MRSRLREIAMLGDGDKGAELDKLSPSHCAIRAGRVKDAS